MNSPDGRVLFLRASFPELGEVMDRCMAEFPRLGATWRAAEKRWIFPSGGQFQFGFCENWQDAQRYLGFEFSYIAFDEIGKLAEERVWSMLLTRLRVRNKSLRVYARCSANPGGAGHGWIKKRFVSATDGGSRVYRDPVTGLTRAFIPSRVTDNPALLANNPTYIAQLQSLPERLRRQLLEGDWDAGSGLAFEELGETHFVEPFDVPSHWTRYGALDWGYSHPWWFGSAVVSEDGQVYVTHVVRGRRDLPDQIAERVEESLGPLMPRHASIAGGLDLWHQVKARGESGPTLAEVFYGRRWSLVKATVSRRSGYQNLLRYLSLGNGEPRLKFFDTPGCRALVGQLSGLTTNPDDPEDVLKIDADPDTGEGGDDGYDMLRYLMMQRPYSPGAQPYRSPFAGHTSNISDGRDPHRTIPVPEMATEYGGQSLGMDL